MESGKILNGLRKDLTNGDVHWTDGPDIGGWSWLTFPGWTSRSGGSIPLHIFSMAGYEIARDLHGKIMDLQISNLSTEDFSTLWLWLT